MKLFVCVCKVMLLRFYGRLLLLGRLWTPLALPWHRCSNQQLAEKNNIMIYGNCHWIMRTLQPMALIFCCTLTMWLENLTSFVSEGFLRAIHWWPQIPLIFFWRHLVLKRTMNTSPLGSGWP